MLDSFKVNAKSNTPYLTCHKCIEQTCALFAILFFAINQTFTSEYIKIYIILLEHFYYTTAFAQLIAIDMFIESYIEGHNTFESYNSTEVALDLASPFFIGLTFLQRKKKRKQTKSKQTKQHKKNWYQELPVRAIHVLHISWF